MIGRSTGSGGAPARIRRPLVLLGVAVVLQVLCGTAIAQGSVEAGDLREAFATAYREGDWERAVEVGEEIDRLTPDDPNHRYNLACVHALAGNADAAIEWLERAIASGFTGLDHLQSDPDLDGIRGHSRYRVVLAGVERNRRLLQEAIRIRFEETPPLLFVPPEENGPRPAPLLIALHGYGGRADGWPSRWRRTAEKLGVVLVIPQAVRPAGPGYSWNDPDEADDILGLTLEWLAQRQEYDRDRVILTGFSQGGYIAMALGRRHPGLFEGVIPMAGGYVPGVDKPPAAGGHAPRYYFMTGALDDSVDPYRQAVADYEAAHYAVKLRVLPGTGHAFPRNTNRELGKALRFVLGE